MISTQTAVNPGSNGHLKALMGGGPRADLFIVFRARERERERMTPASEMRAGQRSRWGKIDVVLSLKANPAATPRVAFALNSDTAVKQNQHKKIKTPAVITA